VSATVWVALACDPRVPKPTDPPKPIVQTAFQAPDMAEEPPG